MIGVRNQVHKRVQTVDQVVLGEPKNMEYLFG